MKKTKAQLEKELWVMYGRVGSMRAYYLKQEPKEYFEEIKKQNGEMSRIMSAILWFCVLFLCNYHIGNSEGIMYIILTGSSIWCYGAILCNLAGWKV